MGKNGNKDINTIAGGQRGIFSFFFFFFLPFLHDSFLTLI